MAYQRIEEELDLTRDDKVDPNLGLEDDDDQEAVSPDESQTAQYQKQKDSKASEEDEPDSEPDKETSEEEPDQKKSGSRFQQRIDQLTKGRSQAEREREEAYQFAQQIIDDNKKLRERLYNSDTSYATTEEERLSTQENSAKLLYRSAAETGDTDKMLEAQSQLSEVAARRQRLHDIKGNIRPEAYQHEYKLPERTPSVDPRVEQWVSDNPWFNSDQVSRQTALAIHDDLVRRQGVNPQSDQYFERLDAEIVRRMPYLKASTPVADPDSGPESEPAPKTNGASRPPVGDARRQSTAKSSRGKVSLSSTEQAVAKRLGLSFEDYAKAKQQLNAK